MNKLTQALNAHFENPNIPSSRFCSVKTERLCRAIFEKTGIQSSQLGSIYTEQCAKGLIIIYYRVGALSRVIHVRAINDLFNDMKPTLAAECFCDKQFKETGQETVCGFIIREGELVSWS